MLGNGGWVVGLPLVGVPIFGFLGRPERAKFSGTAVAMAGVCAVLLALVGSVDLSGPAWQPVTIWERVPGLDVMSGPADREAGWTWLHPGAGLASAALMVSLFFGLFRMPAVGVASLCRLTARALACVLAVTYLGYMIWAVPDTIRGAREFQSMVQAEVEGRGR